MSLQIGKIYNIPINLHFTLIIVFFLVSWTLVNGFMPEYYPDLQKSSYWIMGITGSIILFFSIFLHELSHSLVCIKYNIRVRKIILFIFGGISDILDEPKNFKQEFKIAIAGPITSFILSSLFFSIYIILNSIIQEHNEIVKIIEGILMYSSIINFLIGIFNLVPAFPLDGGRILRSVLIRFKKDFYESTKISVQVGIAIAYSFIALGFIIIINGSFLGGTWFILIGWFIQAGAQSYLKQYELSQFLAQIELKEVMSTNIVSIKLDSSFEILLDLVANNTKSSYPVIDNQDNFIGIILLSDILKIKSNKFVVHISDIVIPKNELIILEQNDTVDIALREMNEKNNWRAFITSDDRLLGIVSKADIINTIKKNKSIRIEN
ncbi:MAG: site-2 protease family protein [Nitrososphaeraceae archaeon]